MSKTSPKKDRLSKRLPVRYGPDTPRFIGFMKNLSAKGAAIIGKVVFSSASRLQIEVDYRGKPLALTGRVCWSSDADEAKRQLVSGSMVMHSMGVEFIERPADYLDFLEMLVESQKESRCEKRCDIILRVTFDSAAELLEEYTNNISMGGTFITCLTPPVLNSSIEVHLFIAEELEVIHVESRVVHVVTPEMSERIGLNPGVGVQFTRFFNDDEAKLKAYIDSLTQGEERRER